MSLTFHATQEAQHTVTHRKRTIHNTKPKTTKNIQYIGCQTSKHFILVNNQQKQPTKNKTKIQYNNPTQPHLLTVIDQEEIFTTTTTREEGEKNNKGKDESKRLGRSGCASSQISHSFHIYIYIFQHLFLYILLDLFCFFVWLVSLLTTRSTYTRIGLFIEKKTFLYIYDSYIKILLIKFLYLFFLRIFTKSR